MPETFNLKLYNQSLHFHTQYRTGSVSLLAELKKTTRSCRAEKLTVKV